MKTEEKSEIRAYIKARFALEVAPKYIHAEMCHIYGNSVVTLRRFLEMG